MLRLALAAVLVLLVQFACAQDAERTVAGTVSLVEGDVRFLDGKLQVRRPRQGDAIYEGEGVVTGSDGSVDTTDRSAASDSFAGSDCERDSSLSSALSWTSYAAWPVCSSGYALDSVGWMAPLAISRLASHASR